MEATASPPESDRAHPRRSTPEIIAGATLITFGALGVFLPFLAGALIATILGAGDTGLAALAQVGQLATSIPLVCLVALLAALGLFRRSRWNRPVATAVAGLLAASPIAMLIGDVAGGQAGLPLPLEQVHGPEAAPVVAAVLYHGFVAPLGAPLYVPLAVAAFGVVVLAALRADARARRRHANAPLPGAPALSARAKSARRPSVAMALLFVLGILSLGPYLAWLLSVVIPRAAVAHGGPETGSGIIVNPGSGLLYAIPSAMASIGALAAARAIWSRAEHGPWIAPAASLIAGPWSALWITVLAAGLSVDSGQAALFAVQLFLYGVGLVCALSFLIVIASVFRRRAWFVRSAAAAPRRGRPGRFWSVTAGIGGALAIPLALGLATAVGGPDLPHVEYGGVLFDGVAYQSAGPINPPGDVLSRVGVLEAWDASIGIEDPAVFTIGAVPATEAIALYDRAGPGEATLSVYVPLLTAVDEHGAFVVPEELCRYVDLEAPGVSVQPCGPPGFVTFHGVDYVDVGWAGFVVAASDTSATNETAVPPAAPDPRIDLTVHTIRDVMIDEAFALLVGSRVVVYQAGTFPSELCRYSPGALSDPLQMAIKEIENEGAFIDDLEYQKLMVPPGCEFPYAVRFGERIYAHDFRDDELYDIPRFAVAPIGVALATERSGGEEEFGPSADRPFPPTLDDTVYGIDGVDPSLAIAFAVLDRFVVLRSNGQGLPVPPELCPYVRVDVVEQYIAEGETDIGCRWGSR